MNVPCWIIIGLCLLVGCSRHDAAEDSLSTKPPADFTDEDVNRVIEEAMRQIIGELAQLKEQFSELDGIDKVNPTAQGFDYTGMKCHVTVDIRYPATSKDSLCTNAMGSLFLKLANGKYLAFMMIVHDGNTAHADSSDPARAAIYRILSTNVGAMLDRLGHNHDDRVMSLPNQ